eukprot:TRINITY_DN5896_c0_g1_i1.p1 TRINITY_DN5896_c0_g1~~TRINITY_DN5896_c0_g1_i1.p1  ORF type:complete len:589 (-),score=133.51 TRINITY_DN5896_c0_g1_i1:345-2111(-)
MARPTQETIDTFISITGASESVAIDRLQAHGGDLNAAVNFYFNEGERRGSHASDHNVHAPVSMEQDDPVDPGFGLPSAHIPPLPTTLSSFRGIAPLSTEDAFERMSSQSTHPEFYMPRPRVTREIPIEDSTPNSTSAPNIVDTSNTVYAQGSQTRDRVENEENLPSTTSSFRQPSVPEISYPNSYYDVSPSAPSVRNDEGSDIEEQMLKAAIEASKKEAEVSSVMQHQYPTRDVEGSGVDQSASSFEDDDFARAVSLSLKTAEQEKAMRELHQAEGIIESSHSSLRELNRGATATRESQILGTIGVDSLSHPRTGPVETCNIPDQQLPEDADDFEEQPLMRRRSHRSSSSRNTEATANAAVDIEVDNSPSNSDLHSVTSFPPRTGDSLLEWGGISSQEHDEAVMLEAALFGGVPEPYRRRIPQPPSPKLEAERLLREQQDDEYLASLQADIEKAELRRKEEEAIREAAAAEEKRLQDEAIRKREEEQEAERQLELKKASLPPEPSEDDNAVTLLVRMPDGTRRGRRFLKSDRLQSLFDFIDIGGGVRPGMYRLVRQYPRRAFTEGEHDSTLNDLGLTSKQEALFLELT